MSARGSALALLSYGIGEMAITVSMTLFGLFVLFFYSSVMGLPPFLVGVGAAAGLLWDAVIDPYIGYRSDRATSRLGRRHGFMLVGSLLMGISFWALLTPPRGMNVPLLFAWLLVTSLVFRTTSALFRIPYLGLGAELSDDYAGRTRVVAVRSFFGLCGTLAAASLSFTLFFPTVDGRDPKLRYDGYPDLGMAAGVVMTITGLIATLGTRRRETTGTLEPAHADEGFVTGFRTAWRSHAFRRVWASFSLFFMAVVLNAVLAIHFYTWYARIADSGAVARLQASFYIGALVGVVGWLWAGHRREKLPMYVGAVAGTAASTAGATLLFGEGTFFGVGNVGALMVGHAVAGVFASAVWVLPGSMLADVADEDALASGRRREGLFFGLLNFGEKVAAGAALLGGGALLQFFVGLSRDAEPDARAALRIGISFGLVPAAMLAASIVAITGYRLNRAHVGAIQQRLRSGAPV